MNLFLFLEMRNSHPGVGGRNTNANDNVFLCLQTISLRQQRGDIKCCQTKIFKCRHCSLKKGSGALVNCLKPQSCLLWFTTNIHHIFEQSKCSLKTLKGITLMVPMKPVYKIQYHQMYIPCMCSTKGQNS